MPKNFGMIAFTPAVQAEQQQHGSFAQYSKMLGEHAPDTSRFGPWEADFIEARDGFYMASVTETGWPYVQYRGGPAGFLKVVDNQTLGFADFRGNRQYISVGNFKGHDTRVALFFMDYATRTRLKVLGRVEVLEGSPEAEEALKTLIVTGYPAKVERAIVIHLEAFDWNCQQHITPRFTAEEAERASAPLRERIAELEAEIRRLKS